MSVSRLSFGTLTFGSSMDEAAASRAIDRCLAEGINFFDTANVYNKGASETVLGKALAGKRQTVIVATKAGFKTGVPDDEAGLSCAAIRKSLDASLKRLQTDYVDLFYLHLPDYAVPIEETLAAMDEAVRVGKVRYPAVSNYAAWQVCEIRWIAEKSGFKPFFVSQPMYNVLARGIEDEYLPFCKRFNIAVVPYNPLAGGLLTGKQSRQRGPIREHASTETSFTSTVIGTTTTLPPSQSWQALRARRGRAWLNSRSNGYSAKRKWTRSSWAPRASSSSKKISRPARTARLTNLSLPVATQPGNDYEALLQSTTGNRKIGRTKTLCAFRAPCQAAKRRHAKKRRIRAARTCSPDRPISRSPDHFDLTSPHLALSSTAKDGMLHVR